MLCVECGEELLAERAELGYRYCTKKDCQAKHHKGLTVTAVAVNKSADAFIVGDEDEIRRRGEDGEFGKKNADLGLRYRELDQRVPAPRPAEPPSPRPTRAAMPHRRPAWTPAQEQLVRLYHQMGLHPAQIVERARQHAPRLRITEHLVRDVLSTLPRR